MTNLRQQIGQAIRLARKRHKAGRLTQEALAEHAGISMETVSNIERGVTLPTVDVLFRIARVVPLDLESLASAEPTDWQISPERLRLETTLIELARDMPEAKLKALVEIARVLVREG